MTERQQKLLEKLRENNSLENLDTFALVLADLAKIDDEMSALMDCVSKTAQDMGMPEKRTAALRRIAARMVIAVSLGEILKRKNDELGMESLTEESIDDVYRMASVEHLKMLLASTQLALFAIYGGKNE